MTTLGTGLMLLLMGAMLRRIVLEAGLRPYDPSRHRLYCRTEGSGPPLLFLHGLAGSWRYWRRGLDGLQAHHALYLPDLLGFGRSPKPRGDYALPMHVGALAPLLDEADGPMTVVGHSMGAIVALGRSWLAPSVCYMKDLLALPIFAPIAGMPVDLYRDYWKHTWASFSRSLFNTLLASDVAGLFESVDRTRINLIHGRHDPVAPIQYVRILVDRFPGLALRELKGGHHLYLMYPRLVNRLISETTHG